MVSIPADKPVTTPAAETDAMEVLLLVHIPEGVVFDSDIVFPITTLVVVAVIAATVGVVITVIADVVTDADPQVLVAVIVNDPAEVIVADAGFEVEVKPPGPVQVYPTAPVAAPVRVIVAPEQTVVADGVADNPDGALFTTSAAVVAVVVPQRLVTLSV